MWNQSSTGGGFGGGGGFLPNASQFGSPSVGGSPKKKSVQSRNMVPVTTAHITTLPESEDSLKIGGRTAHMVTIVGIVTSLEEQSAKITYHIDDLTGPPLEVQLWLGDSDEKGGSERRASISENSYVRVVGSVRNNKGKRTLIAFRVLPIKDLNELTLHLLEVVQCQLALKALQNKESSKDFAEPMGGLSHSLAGPTPMDTSATFESGAAAIMRGMTKNQKLVFQTIMSCKSERGISLDQLTSSLKSLSQPVIKDVIEFLCNEGHIYTTIDDEHFRATEGT